MEDDRNQRGAEAPHSSEPQKAHPTGEFVVVAQNGGCVPFCLGSRLVTVVSEAVSEAVRQNFNFWRFFKILYQATSKRFRVFKDIFHVAG